MTYRVEQLAENVTLYCGDCREVVPHRCGFAVGVFDPPYGIAHASGRKSSWQGKQIAGDADTAARDEVVEHFENAAVFGTWKTPPIIGCKGALVWDKGPAFGMGDLRFPWKGSWELIYLRGRIWQGSRDEGVLRGHIVPSWESKGRSHPHQKPVSLILEVLSKLPDDANVCDPFMGSGSTGVAAVRRGLSFVGCEIDEGHFDTACRRIADELSRPRLFAEPTKPAVQSSLFAPPPTLAAE